MAFGLTAMPSRSDANTTYWIQLKPRCSIIGSMMSSISECARFTRYPTLICAL